jgi:uncharacterized membrane protein YkoI
MTVTRFVLSAAALAAAFGGAPLGAVLGAPFGAVAAQAQPAAPAPDGGDSLGADWREQQNEARQKVREGRDVPLERVIENLRRRTPGRLLDAGIEQGPDGRTRYRVRWASANGRRIDFLVDAHSGAVIGPDGR